MAKRSKNLFLDSDAVDRGERYAEMHGTNLSQLVNNFLSRLPGETAVEPESIPPAVRRLIGIGAGHTGVEQYRSHLTEKYGR